jgi:Fuc2NAc and GlcNAc transferase
LIGFLDDKYNLSALLRATIHLVCAVLAVLLISQLSINSISNYLWLEQLIVVVGATLLIVWSVNLFNFMDGLDGFASVEAIFYFSVGGYLIYITSASFAYLSFIAWALVALLFGFLWWNKPKAKIFMGDACSSFLGFLVAIFAFYAAKHLSISIWLWIYLYGLFWFDASITLMRRILKGERWYESHRSHAYQRLHQAGFSHTQILQGQIIVNILISSLVLWAYFMPTMLLWCGLIELILLAGIYYWVELRYPMYGSKR